ncbi:MAG TPA: Dabb family protein [Bacteroidota bacterium]|nr:Dabb family protein [Bacteroidota bacterium]
MIRHIVLWKFLDEAAGKPKEANLRAAKEQLERLPEAIPEILSFEVGISVGDTSHDLALNSTFASPEALARYQNHREHLRVVEFLRTVHGGKAVVDYAIS